MKSILAAATWLEDRIRSIHPSVSPACKRCGEPLCDALHVFWTCPANTYIEDEEVTSTQNLIPSAVEFSVEFPCMWLRGILPAKFTTIQQYFKPTDLLKIDYINKTHSQICWSSGTYYGDASGGPFSAHATIRRIGCGLAKVGPLGKLMFGAKSNLPGDIQTVPRGELFVLLLLVGLCEPLAEIDYVTDNEGLFKAYQQGPKFALSTANCDLYKKTSVTITCCQSL